MPCFTHSGIHSCVDVATISFSGIGEELAWHGMARPQSSATSWRRMPSNLSAAAVAALGERRNLGNAAWKRRQQLPMEACIKARGAAKIGRDLAQCLYHFEAGVPWRFPGDAFRRVPASAASGASATTTGAVAVIMRVMCHNIEAAAAARSTYRNRT